MKYIGPQSRFEIVNRQSSNRQSYDVVAVLSGLEPHRTLLEKDIIARYSGKEERVLIVQGLMHRPNTRIIRGNITIVPYLNDTDLASALLSANHIIARPFVLLGCELGEEINPIMYTQNEWKSYQATPFYENVQHDAVNLLS